jgi:hypothetical protein
LLVVGLEAAKGEELGTKFSIAEVHIISPEQLEADCLGALVLTASIANSRFEFGVCAVFKANQCGVDLTGCDAA